MHSKISRCSILVLLSVILTALLSFASYSMPTDAVSERVELRTETSKHWQNSDGTLTAEIFSGPVHYRDIDGAWKEIDTRLEPSEKAGFAHSATKNRFKSHLAADAKGRHAVELEGIEFAFTADVLEAALGTVEDSSITYANAWPDADLKYTVLPMGIKEDIILKSRPSVSQFRFIVKSGGLEPVTADRGINFVDKDGKVVVFIPGPFMIDANGAYSDAVEATWRSLSDGTVELLLEPDQEWLSKAVYPVVIDPTIVPATGNSDGYYEFNSKFYSWIGTSTYSIFGKNSANNRYCNACVKWDTSSILPNTVITSATIELDAYNAYSLDNYSAVIKRITGQWPTNQLPTVDSTPVQTLQWSQTGTNTFSGQPITDMVQSWVNNSTSNYGVRIDASYSEVDYRFYTSESSQKPRLIVTYMDTEPPYDPRQTECYYNVDITDSSNLSSALIISLSDININFDPPLNRAYRSKDGTSLTNMGLLRAMATRGKGRFTRQVPSNLLEMVMLTNPYDEDMINNGENRVETFGRQLIVRYIHSTYCGFNFRKVDYNVD